MGTFTVNKLTALALIAGPVAALGFFLLLPGGLLIDSAKESDASGTITALTANSSMTGIISVLTPLSLLVMLFGVTGFSKSLTGGGGIGDALSRFGVLCITVGLFGWIVTYGLTSDIAKTHVEVAASLQSAVAAYRVEVGISAISGLVASLGLLAFSLAVASEASGSADRVAALIVALVSVIALVVRIIGSLDSSQADSMGMIARLVYFPSVVWLVYLGARMLRESGDMAADSG